MDETMVLKYPIAAAAHDAMHVQHKYWSRKPVNVIRAHLEAAATSPDDVILDAFCGSGTTVSQAVILGKKVIGIDINPVATFITRNTIARADVGDLLAIYEQIKAAIADRINALYRTRCPVCLSIDTTTTVCVHWKVHHPIKIWYTCTNCSGAKKPKKLRKMPDAEDLLLLDKIHASEIPAWYPRREIPPGIVFNQARRGATEFADLFTKRNLMALALLRDEITKLPEGTEQERVAKDLFLFSFTSMVHLCSRMTPIRPSRPYSSFWATNSYWLPRFFMESNVWEKFESAIIGPQGLIAAKRDANAKVPPSTTIVSSFDDLARSPAPCAFIVTSDATRIDEIIPENSIDYIFTDPPYAGSIPYLELSTLWALWLNLDDQMPFDDEILVDPGRGKDLEQYKQKLKVFYEKAFLVLKENKYCTFTYHNLDIKVRKAILGAAIEAGFTLDSIIYQPPPRTSPAHTLRPFNSAVGDYIVHLRKDIRASSVQAISEGSTRISKKEKLSIDEEIADELVQILVDRGEPATFTQIINDLDVRLATKDWYFLSDVDPKTILKKNIGGRFITVKEKIGDKEGIKWWLEPTFIKDRGLGEIEPLSRKIEMFIQEHEQELAGLPLQDAQHLIYEQFNGIMLPDAKLIDRLLKVKKSRRDATSRS